MTKEQKVKVFNVVPAQIENVYNAWLDPQALSQFLLPGEDMSITKAETDPQEGGRFSVIIQLDEDDIPYSGEYLSLTPYTQLVFTWESPFSVKGSTVTINLSTVDEGTRVELIHTKFSDQKSRDEHKSGWYRVLGKLNSFFYQ